MSFVARIQITLATIIAVGFVGLLYIEIGLPLINMATGEFSGPFSSVANQIDTVVPLVLSLILLGMVVWLIASSVQEERRRRVRR